MKRSTRMDLAKATVQIVERGHYTTPSGREVDLAGAVRHCLDGTRQYSPDDMYRLRDEALSRPAPFPSTRIEVVNETTLMGIARLRADSPDPIAALNFASAKNPGGGFLNGSHAQEESLARSSALHASLLRAWPFYEQHRSSPTLLYSDAMIFSPQCPIFRDDEGVLLDEPFQASFITSPAPNAGAAAQNCPEELGRIPAVFQSRSELVLALASAQGISRLALGAWGCGVFRNDPKVVAHAFAEHLRGAWRGRFERIVFSVLDTSPELATWHAFREAFKNIA